MTDFQYPTNYGFVIASNNGKRSHAYGMLRMNSKPGETDGLVRCPPIRMYNVKSNGSVVDSWPLTTTCKCKIDSTVSYLHPMLDDNWGVRVYAFNLLNSTQDYFDLEDIPIAFIVKTTQGYSVGANKSVTFLSASDSSSMAYMWAMPYQMPSSPTITGTKNSTIGTRLKVCNSTGYVDSGYNARIASHNGRISFLRVASGTYTTGILSGRTDIMTIPTMWAVVSCSYCTPVSLSSFCMTTSYDTSTSNYPTLTYNTDTGNCMIESGSIHSDITAGSQFGIVHSKKIYTAGGDSGHSIYFVWAPVMGGEVMNLSSSNSNFYTYLPPAIKCEINTSAPSGSTIFCRILQYGIEFNP